MPQLRYFLLGLVFISSSGCADYVEPEGMIEEPKGVIQ